MRIPVVPAAVCALGLLASLAPAQTQPVFRTGVLHAEYNPALPTLFLIGDSTVKNSWDTGGDGLWGWGRPLTAYFDTSKINVENQALGGTSSRSYITQGHWDRDLALIHAGDYVMMQFGHNDGGPAGSLRGNGDETEERAGRGGATEVVHSYGWYIRKYIADAKAKGATPIVCSLIPRNDWADGKVVRNTSNYATWAAEAAKQGGAYFIDLNSIIADRYDKLGQEAVKPFFPKEHTHTGWDGALLNAQCVVEGIKGLKELDLAKYLSAHPEPKMPLPPPPAPAAAAQTPALRKGVSVQMPVTRNAAAAPDADLADSLVVAVTLRGTVFLDVTTVTPDELSRKLKAELVSHPGRRVYVKSDARTPYATVAQVLDAVKAAGVGAPILLTSQSDATEKSYRVPMGLEVKLSSSEGSVAQVGISDAELKQRAQRDQPILLQAEATTPFGDVVHAIDVCRGEAAKVFLAAPQR